MNVNGNRIQQAQRMEEAPGGEGTRFRSPSEVLAILKPSHDEPGPIMIGGLWKTGQLPEGAVS